MRLVESQRFEDIHLAYFRRQDLGGGKMKGVGRYLGFIGHRGLPRGPWWSRCRR
jgi:hypothetical protein